MRKIISFLTITSLLLITFSCGGGGSSQGVSPVTVLASFKINNTTGLRAAASTLTNIRYTVSGSGMDVMTGTVHVTGNLVEFTLDVPNGPQRHFLIEALDINNQVKYTGEANRDLDGTPITIEITLVPVTPPTPPVEMYDVSDYFPLGLGDTWTYLKNDIAYETDTVSGTETIDSVVATKVEADDGYYLLWTLDSNGLRRYKMYDVYSSGGWEQEIYDPPITFLPAEVSIGTVYPYSTTLYYSDSEGFSTTGTASGSMSVVGLESVTVPAGAFVDCVKIGIIENYTYSGSFYSETNKGTLWVAKGVGYVRLTMTEIDFENGEPVQIDTNDYKLLSATVGGVNYQGGDTTPPSVPANLSAAPASATEIDLSWDPSTDDVAVAGYKVYDSLGTYLKSVTTTSTSITGLASSTPYCFSVSAYDTSDNESAKSSQTCATTAACVTGTWVSTDLSYISMTLNQAGSDVTGTWVNSNTGCSYTGLGTYNSSTTSLNITFTTGMNPLLCCQQFIYNGNVNNCNSMFLNWANNCTYSGARLY